LLGSTEVRLDVVITRLARPVAATVALAVVAAAGVAAASPQPPAGGSPPIELGSRRVPIDPRTARGTLLASAHVLGNGTCAVVGKLSAPVVALKGDRNIALPPAATRIGTLGGTVPANGLGRLTIVLTRSALGVLRHHALTARLAGAASCPSLRVSLGGELRLVMGAAPPRRARS
jgi:hypothetical protein